MILVVFFFNGEGVLELSTGDDEVVVIVEQHVTNTSSILVVKLVMEVVLHLLVTMIQSTNLAVELGEETVEDFTSLHIKLAIVFNDFSFIVELAVDVLEVLNNCLGGWEGIDVVATCGKEILDVAKGFTLCPSTNPVDSHKGCLCEVGCVGFKNVVDLEQPGLESFLYSRVVTASELLFPARQGGKGVAKGVSRVVLVWSASRSYSWLSSISFPDSR